VTTPALIPGTHHSVLVHTGDGPVRVVIDGMACPGCGTPLHECQGPTGILTDHTLRPTLHNGDHGPVRRPAGARGAGQARTHRGVHGLYCTWDEDRFATWTFHLARQQQEAAHLPSWALS